jgi:adenosylcobinamide amidohydrolase
VSNVPWRCSLSGRTLAISLPVPWLVLGWAPLGGAFRHADLIINHQIEMGDGAATAAPRSHLMSVIRALRRDPHSAVRTIGADAARGPDTRVGPDATVGGAGAVGAKGAVGMMTGANVARAGHAMVRRNGLAVAAWSTAGCSNALRVGDRATVGVPRAADAKCSQSHTIKPGTINIIVAINQPLTRAAMVEALQIAVEARVAAVYEAGVKSVQSGALATGTGTDCIVVAAPIATFSNRADAIVYCGKHTLPGELIGRAVTNSCATAIERASV